MRDADYSETILNPSFTCKIQDTLVEICCITCSKGDKRKTFQLIPIYHTPISNHTGAQMGRSMAMLIPCKTAQIFLYMAFCECSTPISIVLHLLHISREPLSLLIHDTCKCLLVDWDEWFNKWDNEMCSLPIRCLGNSWLQESGECVCGANRWMLSFYYHWIIGCIIHSKNPFPQIPGTSEQSVTRLKKRADDAHHGNDATTANHGRQSWNRSSDFDAGLSKILKEPYRPFACPPPHVHPTCGYVYIYIQLLFYCIYIYTFQTNTVLLTFSCSWLSK